LQPSAIITLTTDFGTRDAYVAAMKGVILTINPAARIVDISHEVTPGHISEAAYLLREVLPCFPVGTIHTVVVDPGVGGPRRGLVVKTPDGFCVGPDNGVLAPALKNGAQTLAYELLNTVFFRQPVSATFHGRDIFAPTAGHLSLGCLPADLGPRVHDPVILPSLEPLVQAGRVAGRIVHIDRFGNLITNIHRRHLAQLASTAERLVRCGRWSVSGLARTYSDGVEGQLLALVGSSGFLEIAVNRGQASDRIRQDVPAPLGLTVEVLAP